MTDRIGDSPGQRVDERDTVFARVNRRPGTPAYDDYYRRHPELKGVDDRIRARPELCQPGGKHYDEELGRQARRWFEQIDDIPLDGELLERWARRLREAADPAARGQLAKQLCLSLGACAAGCAPLERQHVYSHKGRFDDGYGAVVDLPHDSVVVVLVTMDFDELQRAPHAEVLRESAKQYFRAAWIVKQLAAALEAAGYEAKAHYDAHYDMILPPLAVRAGLGEMGRHNILIAPRHGTRVRIAAVSTDSPVAHDEPISLGARAFCGICKKCADCCPSNALSHDEPVVIRGTVKWPTHIERCYAYWRAIGTDCGVCMAVCPYSHRDNWFHNLVRWAIHRLPVVHRLALRCDDLIYGRRWRPRS